MAQDSWTSVMVSVNNLTRFLLPINYPESSLHRMFFNHGGMTIGLTTFGQKRLKKLRKSITETEQIGWIPTAEL
jgi:methylphosphotriester-DNA--protein-cysteine methyltransferase